SLGLAVEVLNEEEEEVTYVFVLLPTGTLLRRNHVVLGIKYSLPTASVSVVCLIPSVIVTEGKTTGRDQSIGVRINRVTGSRYVRTTQVPINAAIAPTIVRIDLLEAV